MTQHNHHQMTQHNHHQMTQHNHHQMTQHNHHPSLLQLKHNGTPQMEILHQPLFYLKQMQKVEQSLTLSNGTLEMVNKPLGETSNTHTRILAHTLLP
jgi:hypothetical protein